MKIFLLGALVVLGLYLSRCRVQGEQDTKVHQTNAHSFSTMNNTFGYNFAGDNEESYNRYLDRKVEELVEQLFTRLAGNAIKKLKVMEEEALPFLIAALDDERLSWLEFTYGIGNHVDTPLRRIISLIEKFRPPEAVLPLSKHIRHKDWSTRTDVVHLLALIGTPECIAPVRQVLEDKDEGEHLVSFALRGMRRGIKENVSSREFLDSLFPSLVSLLKQGRQAADEVPDIILAIDRERALPILFASEYFSISYRGTYHIIKALNSIHQPIPQHILLPFIEDVKQQRSDHSHKYSYAYSLIAYAHNPDESTEMLLLSELEAEEELIRESAAEALAVLAGVIDPHGFISRILNEKGVEGLTTPQLYYYVLYIYDVEVRNGGHLQYFYNSSGDYWQVALQALEAVGAHFLAENLQKVIKEFGEEVPSLDSYQRNEQVDRIAEEVDFDEFDTALYSSKSNIMFHLALYTIKEKEHFSERK